MTPRDRILIGDMAAFARMALQFAGEGEMSEDVRLKMREFALTRAVEIVGEAAAQVGEQTREAYPEVPWKAAKNMRNVLIHQYGRVDMETVMDTVRRDFPPLVDQLASISMESARE